MSSYVSAYRVAYEQGQGCTQLLGLYMVFAHREGTDVCVNKMVPSIILRLSSFVWFRRLPRQRVYFVNFGCKFRGKPRPNHAHDMLMTLCATSR